MLMEVIANSKLSSLNPGVNYYLDEMHINYTSTGKKNINFTVDVNEGISSDSTMKLNVKALKGDGSSISEGLLTFRK